VNCLASGGYDSQSASGNPAGGAFITGDLCLKCKLEQSWRQGCSRPEVRGEPTRLLNAYAADSLIEEWHPIHA
jgi:hypothetical protein